MLKMNSSELRNQIQSKVQERHGEIIEGFFKFLVKRHNDFCGCNYCELLKKYVQAKITLHREKVYYDRFDYLFYYDRTTALHKDFEMAMLIRNQQLVVKQLKLAKDKLKE